MGRAILVIALAACLAFAAAAPAQRNPDDEKETPREESDWTEIKGVLFPPIPKVRNLIRLDPGSLGTRYEYFIDGPSISLGTDQVIRYTVVLQSNTGVRNVYFEGIHCEAMAAKTYGYASRRGGFKPLASSTWKDVRDHDLGPAVYRLLLADKFMCDSDGWPIDGNKARAKLARAARAVHRRSSGSKDDDSL